MSGSHDNNKYEKVDDPHDFAELHNNPVDVVNPVNFICVAIGLYIVSWIIRPIYPIYPLTTAIVLIFLSAVFEGKYRRGILSRYTYNKAVPVQIIIDSVTIFGVDYTFPIAIPYKFYTTDVHEIIPWAVIDVWHLARVTISDQILKLQQKIK